MNKIFKLNIGGKVFKLTFNIIFAEQIAKVLKVKDPMPENIMKGLISLNEKSSFLMYKAIIYCGILGNDYMNGYDESVTDEEVGKLIVECTPEQLKDIFDTLSDELGYNLKAEAEGNEKKKTA